IATAYGAATLHPPLLGPPVPPDEILVDEQQSGRVGGQSPQPTGGYAPLGAAAGVIGGQPVLALAEKPCSGPRPKALAEIFGRGSHFHPAVMVYGPVSIGQGDQGPPAPKVQGGEEFHGGCQIRRPQHP